MPGVVFGAMRHRKIIDKNLIAILITDAGLLCLAGYFAHLLRFNFQIPAASIGLFTHVLPFIVLAKMVAFYFFDLYKGMWRYTSISDLMNVIKAATVGSLVVVSLFVFSHGLTGFARSVFIIDWVLTIIFISGFRVGIRLFFWFWEHAESEGMLRFLRQRREGDTKNLIILGAGDSGEKIYREIRDNAKLRYRVIGFVDDDEEKVGKKIHGVPILGRLNDLKSIARMNKIDECLIAIPSATSKEMREIISGCEACGLPSKTLPSMGELIDGKVSIKAIRDVAYRDLLGREVIRLEEELIGSYLKDATVMVTGAGGSIGSELCRQICRFEPKILLLFERAESPLYEIEIELKATFPDVGVVPLLADIRNRNDLTGAFESFDPNVIFHAAAYKHVPMLELQPWNAIKNNILGTRNVVEFSNRYKVDRFVFVSTDKAVRPSNIMGSSKRVAELLVQGQNGCRVSDTRFMTVRFGNVVGSVGSVVPLFKRQIEMGGPVTVTHKEVTRYFMTIPEACQLILQAGAMGEGGEIFIFDMGTPIKIDEMARDLIRLSGFEPGSDIEIVYTGLRPGEKLYEELITEGEGIVATRHEKIMVIRGETCDQEMLNARIDELSDLATQKDDGGIRRKLKELLPEYVAGGKG